MDISGIKKDISAYFSHEQKSGSRDSIFFLLCGQATRILLCMLLLQSHLHLQSQLQTSNYPDIIDTALRPQSKTMVMVRGNASKRCNWVLALEIFDQIYKKLVWILSHYNNTNLNVDTSDITLKTICTTKYQPIATWPYTKARRIDGSQYPP